MFISIIDDYKLQEIIFLDQKNKSKNSSSFYYGFNYAYVTKEKIIFKYIRLFKIQSFCLVTF